MADAFLLKAPLLLLLLLPPRLIVVALPPPSPKSPSCWHSWCRRFCAATLLVVLRVLQQQHLFSAFRQHATFDLGPLPHVEERATIADAQNKDRLGNNRRRGALVVVAVEVMREAILNDASFMEWDELGQLCVCLCVCVCVREREREREREKRGTHTTRGSYHGMIFDAKEKKSSWSCCSSIIASKQRVS